jgi:TrmH family RNA methyltransferase
MGMRKITSAQNSLVKKFRRALTEGVTREGWLGVEGPLLVEEALEAATVRGSRVRVHSVLLAHNEVSPFEDFLRQLPSDIDLTEIPDRLFEQLSPTAHPQGVAALIEIQPPDLATILRHPQVLLLVICGLQDPGNLGTILRTAEAFGADAVMTLKTTVSLWNPKVIRSSGGAIFRLPLFPGLEADGLFERLRRERIQLIAADRSGDASISEADFSKSVAFLIGNEAGGLAQETLEKADRALRIPIRQGVDSVNAAIAAGIFLYEAARQRGFRY